MEFFDGCCWVYHKPLGWVGQALEALSAFDKSGGTVTVECYVTLLQMAGIVNKSKRTLERLRDNKKLPAPAVKGGAGRASEWQWSVVRPILERQYKRSMPEVFPADRFVR